MAGLSTHNVTYDATDHTGGARGIRTPDLLIANETRYQLRHSPMLEQLDDASTGRRRTSIRQPAPRLLPDSAGPEPTNAGKL